MKNCTEIFLWVQKILSDCRKLLSSGKNIRLFVPKGKGGSFSIVFQIFLLKWYHEWIRFIRCLSTWKWGRVANAFALDTMRIEIIATAWCALASLWYYRHLLSETSAIHLLMYASFEHICTKLTPTYRWRKRGMKGWLTWQVG